MLLLKNQLELTFCSNEDIQVVDVESNANCLLCVTTSCEMFHRTSGGKRKNREACASAGLMS